MNFRPFSTYFCTRSSSVPFSITREVTRTKNFSTSRLTSRVMAAENRSPTVILLNPVERPAIFVNDMRNAPYFMLNREVHHSERDGKSQPPRRACSSRVNATDSATDSSSSATNRSAMGVSRAYRG